MSSDQININPDKDKQRPVEVIDWNGLVQYTQILCQGPTSKVKICLIDEEDEEICIQTKDEFDLNVKYAQDHGMKSLSLVVYIDDKHIFNGIYHIEKPIEKLAFPIDKLKILEDKVLAEKWYIPVKQDEALGVCLTAAIKIAQEGKIEENADCKRFVENIVPDAFYKLQTTKSVFSWPREVQCGIFEMLELFIDLIGTRLLYPPVPIELLNTLALTFDTTTAFSQKHKNESLPIRRVYALKDEDFLRENIGNETFGWLRSLIQRFIAQNGLQSIRLQFEYIDSSNSMTAAKEYNALLKIFSKCNLCINAHRFHLIFTRSIRQALQYLQTQDTSNELKELYDTLIDICYKYEIRDEIAKLRALPYNSNVDETLSTLVDSCSETTPLIEISMPVQRKSKHQDCYETLAENIRILTMNNNDAERKNIKKQRTDEQIPTPLFTRNNIMDCIDELLTSTEKRSLKRKHHREQRSSLSSMNTGHINKKEIKRSNTITIPPNTTYDRSNPEDILRYFAPMKLKIAALYDNLQLATSNGDLREVLKIEEKIKLLHPFSARFIADENTPDGTPMKPGQIFRKGWILLNDGSMPWDSNDIQLINLNDGIQVLQQPIVPVTAPHARTVISVEFMCSNEPGIYESKWILSYRQQTFGPMIWCTIEVSQWSIIENELQSITSSSSLNELDYVEVPLPDCFDLSKPYQPGMKTSSNSSMHTSSILHCDDSTELLSTYFNTVDIDDLQSSYQSDTDSLSTFTDSSPVVPQIDETSLTTNSTLENPTKLIELPLSPPPTENRSMTSSVVPNNNEENQSIRLNPPLDFVDTVVTNIFTVAKQAGSTAKAIFHTLQAYDEPITPVTPPVQEQEKPILINTYNADATNTHGFSGRITNTSISTDSSDPMKTLIEMGFANRAKNQRLLKENANDLAKVIELLTIDNNDSDWFTHRH
ncbi:unnamed protein product [Rotaria sp. Silwood1]|nr:unnamed protein product [Rotaria sp. Silwood1]CAF1004980.1 unnamed protein product [Rotaria sp. Silwood1]CAF3387626.1 unnamed protein product [Rotaria sp. Silwood1]CAF4528042.1 unnamed protein product [Rotaria sp. Silwood1]